MASGNFAGSLAVVASGNFVGWPVVAFGNFAGYRVVAFGNIAG